LFPRARVFALYSCSLAGRRAKEGEAEEGAGAGAKRICTAMCERGGKRKKTLEQQIGSCASLLPSFRSHALCLCLEQKETDSFH
jgi:hypothetical protein